MKQTYFVTGTDTDVGKTVCCKALLQAANQQGKMTLAYKPIAAGCELTADGLRNEDALILQKNSSLNVAYELINPIAFKEPIAPHIAAEIENKPIQVEMITCGLLTLQAKGPDLLIVEGAGGWSLPLNHQQLLSEWVVAQQLPVIMVVGMKLGCLNHALLTYQSILHSGLKVAGWIANQLQAEMPFYQQNLALLTAKIDAPMIAEIPYLSHVEKVNLAQYVNLALL
ncbi:dethiobiotin synthase [Psychromonas hadalis]|uniref:dethiobiotin synthase n=1 Tax=Psychromonas hadalis TaxID=211669 RepID=UPI0003FFBBEF|nr:dethiobiotin synthase [Psychromonas hadalis]